MAEKKVYHGNLPKACAKEQEIGQFLAGVPFSRYELPRDEKYQDVFQLWLNSLGFDDYGDWVDSKLIPFIDKNGRFHNGTFAIMPYYWGDDEKIAAIPNFIYFPENIQIFWYKYPFRGATISENLSPEEFREMLKKCSASLEYSLRAAKKEKR